MPQRTEKEDETLKKIWNLVAKDLWIVLLDIIAVNAAYYLALMVRFYVNFEFRPTVTYYLTDFWHFAPFYTILSVIIFAAFRLYGGMWRYAGLNDMNRIILANACTAVVQVVGTALFVRRMPITYYLIGAMLQFLLVSLIRFAYRILLVEKKKIGNRNVPMIPTLVVGSGETARKAIHYLDDSPYRATMVFDEKDAGKSMDGIQVTGDFDNALTYVRSVVIADASLSAERRKEIKEKCAEKGIEVRDYTGYLNNLGGRIPVSALLELAEGSVTLVIDGKETVYKSGEEAIRSIQERYDVRKIEGMKIELVKPTSNAYVGYDAWAEQHKEQTGEDVSFF